MLLLVIAVPIAMGLVALAVPSPRIRPWLVPAGGVVHAILTAIILTTDLGQPMFASWLALGALGRVLLGFLSAQYLVCSFYVPGYLALRPEHPNRMFCAALLVLIGTMSAVVVSHHLGLMWVAVESSTLATAPLIYFHQQPALAGGDLEVPADRLGRHRARAVRLVLPRLRVGPRRAATPRCCSRTWCATRRGCPGRGCTRRSSCCWSATAPRSGSRRCTPGSPTPTARRPGLVGALLAGGLTSCAFCALLRFVQICYAAGDGALARQLLLALGLVSMAVAARVHGAPARLQAHAGVLQRRAHGDHRVRHRDRRARRRSARCST